MKMRVVGLISGGKDSCYNLMQCVREGHTVVALGNLKPADKDELDSYMYQTVGHHAIDLYAEAMALPLYRRVIRGGSLQQGKDYHVTEDDEVEDLTALLKHIKSEVDFEAVSVGAILSDYQRIRVEHVCMRLGVTPLAYLWRRDQAELLREMIDSGVKAVLIKVAALGLSPEKHLGRSLEEIYPHMINMHFPIESDPTELNLQNKYGLNPCGEGGEYETFTLDCPLFTKKLVIDRQETVIHSQDAFAPVAYLNFTEMHLEEKTQDENLSLPERLNALPMKTSHDILKEIGCHDSQDQSTVTKEMTNEDVSCLKCTLNRSLWHYERCRESWTSVTGVVALTTDAETVEGQTRTAMETLRASLQRYDLRTSDIVAVCLYVNNMADFTRVNSVYKTYFAQNPPIRVCVEAGLPVGVALQLDCVASGSCQSTRETMHVQSVSHWAPANIGPYSQAVKKGDVVVIGFYCAPATAPRLLEGRYCDDMILSVLQLQLPASQRGDIVVIVGSKLWIAGQIALVPGSMRLVSGGILPQARLSLRHVHRVVQAMAARWRHCLVVCYVTDTSFIDVGKLEWRRFTEQQADESSVESLCEFVVIPRLPRDALIEWQVYVWTDNSSQIEEYRSAGQREGLSASCVCQSVASDSGEEPCISFKASVAHQVEANHHQSPSALTMLELCLQVLHTSLTKLHAKENTGHVTNQLTSLRVFYSTKWFQNSDLFTEFRSAWMSVFGETEPIPPAFVPVLALDGVNKVLTICH